MLPEATRASIWSSKSSQFRKVGGTPERGNISKILIRVEARAVITPRERLLCRLGERMGARGHDLHPTAAREVTHLPAQTRQLPREVGGRRVHGGEHLYTRA